MDRIAASSARCRSYLAAPASVTPVADNKASAIFRAFVVRKLDPYQRFRL